MYEAYFGLNSRPFSKTPDPDFCFTAGHMKRRLPDCSTELRKRFDIENTHIKDDLLEIIYEKVYEDYTRGVTPVIIIDEAQLIPGKGTFDEIRLLTNFQLDEENLLSLILIGQPDLSKRLERSVYLPLRQRIGVRYHLNPLNEDEVREYLMYRLRVAGRT